MVTAYDSGARVVVTLNETDDDIAVVLSIGTDVEDLGLSVPEAQRVIDALTEGLARLGRLRAGDARD